MPTELKATTRNGDQWTGERNDGWWIMEDSNGNLYETREIPEYRIRMNAIQVKDHKGNLCIHFLP